MVYVNHRDAFQIVFRDSETQTLSQSLQWEIFTLFSIKTPSHRCDTHGVFWIVSSCPLSADSNNKGWVHNQAWIILNEISFEHSSEGLPVITGIDRVEIGFINLEIFKLNYLSETRSLSGS